MDVRNGVVTSDVTEMYYSSNQLRFSNTNMTGSRNGSDMNNAIGNYTDMSAPKSFVNGLTYSDMPEDDEMDTEVKRLSSFKNWPVSSPVKPKDLAAAGFYFVGRDDQVRCFRCDLTLRKWEKEDIPFEEHKNHKPMCPFVREKLREERDDYNITCEPVEASGSKMQAFPSKDAFSSQMVHSATTSLHEFPYDSKFQPSNTAPFYGQNKVYEPLENYPGSRYTPQAHGDQYHPVPLPNYNRQSQDNMKKSVYSVEEYRANKSFLPVTSKQQYSKEEQGFSGISGSGHSGFYEGTSLSGESSLDPRTKSSAFMYPSQMHPSFAVDKNVQDKSNFVGQNEPKHTIYLNQFKGVTQINEQNWLPTKDPKTENVFEETQQHKLQKQMLPPSGSSSFVNPNLKQVIPSTEQKKPWLGGYNTSKPTRRVVPNAPIPSGVFQQGSVQQGPLFRQEGVRHGSSMAELKSEHHRLTTFVDWPQNSPINPCELAAAGFYYLGTGDNVKCYKCGRGLCNWDPDDTPWGEHLKWSSDCPLVIEHFKGRRALGPAEGSEPTSEQRVENSRSYHAGSLQFEQKQRSFESLHYQTEPTKHQPHHEENTQIASTGLAGSQNFYEKQQPTSAEVFTFMTPVTVTHPSKTSCSESSNPLSPHLSQDETMNSPDSPLLCPTSKDIDRLVSMGFSRAVIEEVISAQFESKGHTFRSVDELTNAVLEYGGRNAPSSSERQHSATSPVVSPTYQGSGTPSPSPLTWEITGGAGEEFTHNSDANTGDENKEENQRNQDFHSSAEHSSPSHESAENESLEKKLERMLEERTCKICMDAQIGVVFLPCGHLICCPNCASGVELCPMCRQPILESIRTYMS